MGNTAQWAGNSTKLQRALQASPALKIVSRTDRLARFLKPPGGAESDPAKLHSPLKKETGSEPGVLPTEEQNLLHGACPLFQRAVNRRHDWRYQNCGRGQNGPGRRPEKPVLRGTILQARTFPWHEVRALGCRPSAPAMGADLGNGRPNGRARPD